MKSVFLSVWFLLLLVLISSAAQIPLNKIDQSGATNGQVATWDQALGKWVPNTPAGSGGSSGDHRSSIDTQAVVTIQANTGVWFRLCQISTSSFVSTTVEAGFVLPSQGTAAKIRMHVGRGGTSVAPTPHRIAVVWADGWTGLYGFGGVGSDSAGTIYVQITNLTGSAISPTLQAAAWTDANPDMAPQIMWGITTQSIATISAGTITYMVPGDPIIAYPRGEFGEIHVHTLNVDSNTINLGSTTLSDSGGQFSVSTSMRVAGDQTIVGNGYIGVGMTNPPSALTVDGDMWTTNGWMMAHRGAKNRTNELTWTNGLSLNGVAVGGSSGGGAYAYQGTNNNIVTSNANGNAIGAQVKDSVVSGGGSNVINSLVTGGETPRNNGVLAGRNNVITNGAYGPDSSVIGAGWLNKIGGAAGATDPSYSFIGAGIGNWIEHQGSFIGAGVYNTNGPSALYSFIGAGERNLADAQDVFIGGGAGNSAIATYDVIGGGQANTIGAGATHSTVGGGNGNGIGASAAYSTVGGGNNNNVLASATYDAICGGGDNIIGDTGENVAYCFIGGGRYNWIKDGQAIYATIGGGFSNKIDGLNVDCWGAVIAGGNENRISQRGYGASIGGGIFNVASNYYATVPGGANNLAAGTYSFAAGRRARALHSGSFVMQGNVDADLDSSGTNQLILGFNGGVCINTNAPGVINGTNAMLTVLGGAYIKGDLQVNSNSVYIGQTHLGETELKQLYTSRKLTNIFAALSFLLLINFGRDRWRERKNKQRDEEQLRRILELERKLGT